MCTNQTKTHTYQGGQTTGIGATPTKDMAAFSSSGTDTISMCAKQPKREDDFEEITYDVVT